jgi:hypothetical protein
MPPTCTVCRLPNRHEAEEALLAGEPLRNIAERFGTSATALHRHKESHLAAKLVKAEEAREIASADTLVGKLVALEGVARRLCQKAEKDGDPRTALMAVRELVRQIELAARISGELEAAKVKVQVNVGTQPVFSPEERRHLTILVYGSYYSDDPAAFLEEIREEAARSYVTYRPADQPALTHAEARALLESRERTQRIGPGAIEEAAP